MSSDQENSNVAINPEEDNNVNQEVEQQTDQPHDQANQEANEVSIDIDKQEDIDIDKHENIDIDKHEKIEEDQVETIALDKQMDSLHPGQIQSGDVVSIELENQKENDAHDDQIEKDANEQENKIDSGEQIKNDTDEPTTVEPVQIVTDEQEATVGDPPVDSVTKSQHNNDDEIPLLDINQENGDERQHIDEGAEQPIEDNNGSSDMIEGNEEIMVELRNIAETGAVSCDWDHLQKILTDRLESVLTRYIERSGNKYRDEEYQEPNVEKFELENSRKEIEHLISSFSEPPFTIQRICELLCTPFIYYDKISTFLRGLEKNLRVS